MGNSGNITSIFSFCYSIDNLCAKAYIISIAKHTFSYLFTPPTKHFSIEVNSIFVNIYILRRPTQNEKNISISPVLLTFLFTTDTHKHTHIYIYTYLNIKIAFNWLHLFLKAFFVQKSKTIKIFDGQEKTKKRVKNFFNSFFLTDWFDAATSVLPIPLLFS